MTAANIAVRPSDALNEKAAAVTRGGFFCLAIMKRFHPSLAGLAATYSSKP